MGNSIANVDISTDDVFHNLIGVPIVTRKDNI